MKRSFVFILNFQNLKTLPTVSFSNHLPLLPLPIASFCHDGNDGDSSAASIKQMFSGDETTPFFSSLGARYCSRSLIGNALLSATYSRRLQVKVPAALRRSNGGCVKEGSGCAHRTTSRR